MSTVLLSQEIHKDAVRYLRDQGFKIEISPSPDDEVVRKYIRTADAVIVRTATKLSRETIFIAKNLKVIARTGSGVDNVDINAASDRNIPVCYTPEANTESVAEHTIALMLACAKYLNKMDLSVRKNNFIIRNNYLPVDLNCKTLGLIGFGKIGRNVAKKCSNCFDMHIIIYDPFLSDIGDLGFSFSRTEKIDDIVINSDFISIHIPYTGENHHIINNEMFDKMQKSAFLINTSRGGIIDEEALAHALLEGKIAGAALDVFEDEPPHIDNPLLKIDNIILTPHSAALTRESARRMAIHAAEGVADVLKGRKPKWVFNIDKIKLQNT